MARMRGGVRALTKKQRDILVFIIQYIRENSYPPSIREIGDSFGIKSTNGVFDHLNALARKEYIRRQYFTSRSIVVVRDPDTGLPVAGSDIVKTVAIPFLGEAAAGLPIVPFEHVTDFMNIDADLMPKKVDKTFCIKIKGESMSGDGIGDGDLIIVQKQTSYKEDMIVLVKVDEEVTVKRYQETSDGILLKSSNKDYKPIKVSKDKEFKVLGKVTAVFHTFA